jgi:hypothetical protein
MKQFRTEDRPPYFVDSSYCPEGAGAYSNWNVLLHSIPDPRSWIYDRIEYYVKKECRDSTVTQEVINIVKTARNYDDTCIGASPQNTIITHMYVCELLVKALLLFFGVKPTNHHGYSKKESERLRDFYCTNLKDGISQDLHSLFYSTPLPKKLPSLEEYLRFLPETRKECYSLFKKAPHIFKCVTGFTSTGAHSQPGHYHFCNPIVDTSTIPGLENLYKQTDIIFPEKQKFYILKTGQGRSTNFPAEEHPYCDDIISTTEDIYGTHYALGFGESDVPKQRDLEIRFYLVFLLGSIARYSPNDWLELAQNDPELFIMVRLFLENNHLSFPFFILRYITGRGYSLKRSATYG